MTGFSYLEHALPNAPSVQPICEPSLPVPRLLRGCSFAYAQLHGIASRHVAVAGRSRDEYDGELTQLLEAAGCEIVLLVGYMRILSATFCNRWKRRALNVHPSLLPKFGGGMDLEVHKAVLAAGEKETGCTVHLVEAEVDSGESIVQKKCFVIQGESPESLKVTSWSFPSPARASPNHSLASDAHCCTYLLCPIACKRISGPRATSGGPCACRGDFNDL